MKRIDICEFIIKAGPNEKGGLVLPKLQKALDSTDEEFTIDGIADMFQYLEMPYGCERSIQICKVINQRIKQVPYKYHPVVETTDTIETSIGYFPIPYVFDYKCYMWKGLERFFGFNKLPKYVETSETISFKRVTDISNALAGNVNLADVNAVHYLVNGEESIPPQILKNSEKYVQLKAMFDNIQNIFNEN